jgi:phenylpropionate dioxygenase-like ring-hydroxylating dioxygenase large terminal subunit
MWPWRRSLPRAAGRKAAVRGIPASHYLDPARGLLEFPAIFGRGWQFVCHAADLPAPGTAARFDCAGRSAFVLRGRDGDLRAFRNACRHRGSRLVDGDPNTGLAFCVGGRVRCPYHGWTYDERGALESVPPGQRFDALGHSDLALATVAVAQWSGLVFVALDTPERSLAEALGTAQLDWPDAASLRRLGEPRVVHVAADWKLACELLLDEVHWSIARPVLKPRVIAPAAFVPSGDDALVAAASLPQEQPEMQWPERAYARLLRWSVPVTTPARMLFAWPNLLLDTTPDGLTAMQVLPRSTGACTLRVCRYGRPDATREMRLLRYLHDRVLRRTLREDRRVLERVQQGLANVEPSHAPPLAESERALQWFAGRYLRACSGVDGGVKARKRAPRRPATGVDV